MHHNDGSSPSIAKKRRAGKINSEQLLDEMTAEALEELNRILKKEPSNILPTLQLVKEGEAPVQAGGDAR